VACPRSKNDCADIKHGQFGNWRTILLCFFLANNPTMARIHPIADNDDDKYKDGLMVTETFLIELKG